MSALKPTQKEYVQFSKKITIAATILWGCFRLLTLILIAFRPETAEALTLFQKGADDVMMVAIGFYCGNSVAEKGILGYFGAKKERVATDESCDEEALG